MKYFMHFRSTGVKKRSRSRSRSASSTKSKLIYQTLTRIHQENKSNGKTFSMQIFLTWNFLLSKDKSREIHKSENSVQKKRHYRNNRDSSRSESPERVRDRPDRSNNRRSTSRHRRNSRNRSPKNRSRSPRRDNRDNRDRYEKYLLTIKIANKICRFLHFGVQMFYFFFSDNCLLFV